MTLTVTLTAAATSVSGPFPPNYGAGAQGFTAAASNPSGDSAGSLSSTAYYSSTILALANDAAVNPTQVLLAISGTQDQSYIGTLTTPDGKTYAPAAASVFEVESIGGFDVSVWIWPIASGGSALANGTVTIGDTGDLPLQIQGDAPSSTEIDLTWTNAGPTPPTAYLLYRGVNSSLAAPTLYQTLGGTSYEYHDTGLTANLEYSYYVVATYADSTNETSPTIQLFTPASGISATFNCNCTAQVPDGWQVDTLANLRTRVAINSGYAAQANNLPPGMKALINEKLRTAQNQLYRQHFEKKTIRLFAWQMEINQRYYGLSQDMSDCGALDPLSIDWVGFEDLNQAWYPLIEGIDPILYTRAQISTGWPTHYEIRQCIEIFPAPRAAYTLWIKGRFGLTSFVNDTDITTIDSEAIQLLATGMVKSHYGQPDAGALLTQAMNYTKYLVAGMHGTARYVPRTRIQTPMTPPRFLPLES